MELRKRMAPKLTINELVFVGKDTKQASLRFPTPFSFIYGASNTGKSFAVKAIDFMLGANRELPSIEERGPYNTVGLDLKIDEQVLFLERALVGGDFRQRMAEGTERVLAARHDRNTETNLSNYILGLLGIAGREIATDKSSTKKPLSFRDIVRFCITDETSIQSEISPVESGNITLAPAERNTFKFLLTGEDDSALITQVKPKDFRTGRRAQVQIIEDMILEIDAELAEDYPDADKLPEQSDAVESSLKSLEADIVAARASVRASLDEKKMLIEQISADRQRARDIAISLENFEQLQAVYSSDIARLEALEEAGFLFSLDAKRSCPVCGAPPEAQIHDHGLGEIERTRASAEAEIAKIKVHVSELAGTIVMTQQESEATGDRLAINEMALEEVERELRVMLPNADEQQKKFAEIIPRRDRINHGLSLLARRESLAKQKARIEKAKQVKSKTNFAGGLSTQTAQEFADEVASVLTDWAFPGQRRVVFDLETYDLIIDGKRRRDNGKGVRAITHAAFKVALLTYCRRRGRPHPGFLILDTPLITYRDPMRSRAGALTPDEEVIRNTDLKERMFEHLGSTSSIGQFILFDNSDPPANATSFASVEAFTNDPKEGRQGLLGSLR